MSKEFVEDIETTRTVDDFKNDTMKLIGLPVYDPRNPQPEWYQARTDTIELDSLRNYAGALGDDNPLYFDEQYARGARYGGVIAHPTYTSVLRYGICRGSLVWHPYPIVGLVAGFGWEWNNVIRLGDSFKTSLNLKEVFEKKGSTGRLIFTITEGGYWNQFNELAATGNATWIGVGREIDPEELKKGEGLRESMVYERDVYHYSQDEINDILEAYDSEEKQGAKPLYWENVEIGDKLPRMVRGPLTLADMMQHHAMDVDIMARPNFGLRVRQYKNSPGGSRVNPVTGWPYEDWCYEHYDFNLCRGRGLPAPFDVGCMRAQLCSTFLSNWMGDHGFMRRLLTQFRKPNYYGDTVYYSGEVVKTYKDQVGDEEYGAVDIRIMAINQIGEPSCPGTATIYLPSPGKPIKLPIPHDDKYEEYEEYLKKCEEIRTNPPKI